MQYLYKTSFLRYVLNLLNPYKSIYKVNHSRHDKGTFSLFIAAGLDFDERVFRSGTVCGNFPTQNVPNDKPV